MTCICESFKEAHYHARDNPHDQRVTFYCDTHGKQERYWLIHTEVEEYCVPCGTRKEDSLHFNGQDLKDKGLTICPECKKLTWVGTNNAGIKWMCQNCWFDIINSNN